MNGPRSHGARALATGLAVLALGTVAAPARAGVRPRSRTFFAVTGFVNHARVSAKVTFRYRFLNGRSRGAQGHWILTDWHVRFAAGPAVAAVGDGRLIYWTGWTEERSWGPPHRKWHAVEQTGSWQYWVQGQCTASFYLRLRAVFRAPRNGTNKGKATTLAMYALNDPLASDVRVAVHERYMN